jgi:glycosyltransferase involved in cell wall biosynthesis
VSLVLCGQYGWNTGEIRRRVAAATEEGWLEHLGYLPVADLVATMRGAAVAVMPSLYEGFGLPALEALELGVPLVASDLPVLREIAVDAALYAPPDDAGAWAAQLERVLSDPDLASDLVERGRLRAARFSWPQAVEETVEVLRLAVG